jgi:hypothetical protein
MIFDYESSKCIDLRIEKYSKEGGPDARQVRLF